MTWIIAETGPNPSGSSFCFKKRIYKEIEETRFKLLMIVNHQSLRSPKTTSAGEKIQSENKYTSSKYLIKSIKSDIGYKDPQKKTQILRTPQITSIRLVFHTQLV